jgi:hypothetical protein
MGGYMGGSSLAAHMYDIHPSKDTIAPVNPLVDPFNPGYSSSNEPFLRQNFKMIMIWCHMATMPLRGLNVSYEETAQTKAGRTCGRGP